MKSAKIAIAGNVDSGKTSLCGVLTSGILDNGRGSARSNILKLKHEKETGRTTNITLNPLVIDINGNKKIHSLIDLCGHEKYLKTTMYGLTGLFVDYGIVVIGANMGITKMTREHIGILLWAKIPFTIVITKIDICPDNIYEATLNDLRKILKSPIYNKQLFFLNKDENITKNEIDSFIDKININYNITPILPISNKTGNNINNLKYLLQQIEPREQWKKDNINGSVFYIDSVFMVKGVGIVLSGTLHGNTIKVNDKLFIGPYNGSLIPVKVKTMHNNNREYVNELNNGDVGCIAISFLKELLTRKQILKGMVVVNDTKFIKNVSKKFKATITVLHHSTTIKNNYQPVIHCRTIRQNAIINVKDDNLSLRTGDKATVYFTFMFRPEYIEKGAFFFFRDGSTKGVGIIEEIVDL